MAGGAKLKASILELNEGLKGIWAVGSGGNHIGKAFVDALNGWYTWGNYNLSVKYFDEIIIVCRYDFTIQRHCYLP